MTVGDLIRERRAQDSEVKEVLEGSLEGVEMTAHALWMHSMDLTVMHRNTPEHFKSNDVIADIWTAHRRLGDILAAVDSIQATAVPVALHCDHPVSEDAA